ncbi:amidohydrolase family protein [Pseudomonadota bacterium]
MGGQVKPQIIAIEEHYMDPLVAEHWTGVDAKRPPKITERLADLEQVRLREMDDAGIDIQVLSHAPPATQRMDAETAVPVAKAANDKLNDTILKHPDRYAGFAVLPTADPKASADELERTVTKYGFKGAMIHGPSNGVFIDDKQFWPIFERAQELDVPLYMHPANPHPDVVNAYYADYKDDYPTLVTAAWGFTVETATQGIRLVLSGL